MLPTIRAEEGYIGKFQQIDYFLDGFVGILQQMPDVKGDVFVNPVECRLSAYPFAYGREVFGRDTQLFGIPRYIARFHNAT